MFGSAGGKAGEKVAAFSCRDGRAADQLLQKVFRAGAAESVWAVL
jgi:hypothetical protein